jgi:hypothetical protein
MAFNVIRKEKAKEKEKQKKRFLHLLYRYLILILETRTKRTWSVYRREAIGNWKTKEEKADRSLVILFSFFFFLKEFTFDLLARSRFLSYCVPCLSFSYLSCPIWGGHHQSNSICDSIACCCFFFLPTDPVFPCPPPSAVVVVVVLISTFVGRETRRLDFGPDFYRFSFVLFFLFVAREWQI